MKVNEQRTPPGGWHFPADEKIRLEAHDKKTLIDRLFEYRLRNGLATGTEEADIDNYFCSKWPSSCNLEPRDYGQHVPSKMEQLLYRVSRWASGLIDTMPRGGYALVSLEEMQRRAAICRACPQNLPWKGRCPGCAGSTISLLTQVRKLHQLPEGMRGCQILGWENGTAAFLPFERLGISEGLREQLPAHCWRK